jgi:RNA polymerase sigma-70 factor (ECF subfamily)
MLPFSGLSVLGSRTDEETMGRVKATGDHREFARLVERWEQPIWRLCARMSGDLHRGEDLKQETFARLFEQRHAYQPGGRFSTWLWRIALNVCYDELRRVERRRRFLSESAEAGSVENLEQCAEETPGPADRVAQLEEGDLVRQALLQLPDIYRSVIVLRHYEGLKLAKIADILDIPEGTVNSRMAEALQRLSRLLEPKLREQRQPLLPNPLSKPIEVFLL